MVPGRKCAVLSCVISLLLLAGCASSPNHPAPRARWEPSVKTAAIKSAPADKPRPEFSANRVEAYAHYIQGTMFDLELNPDAAQEEFMQAASLDSSNEDLVLELTRRYLRQKQPEKAVDMLVRATVAPGASGALFAELGLVYSHLGKEEPAIAACQNAIRLSPKLVEGYRVLFFLHIQSGHPIEGRKVLEQAMKVPDTSPEFIADLVDLCAIFDRQAPSEKKVIAPLALEALGRADAQNPTDAKLRMRMADEYMQLGDATNATRIYRQVLAAFGEVIALRGDIHDKLARIYLQANDYTNATEQLEAIVQDDPSSAQAYTLLGSLAEDHRDVSKAEEYYRKALILNDGVPAPYYDLARVQIAIDQPREAIATLERARLKFANSFLIELLSAHAFQREKDYTNAVNRFTSAEVIAKATNPKLLNEEFYFFQGSAYERAGNYDQAEKCFQKSLELKPNSPEALNYLGYMWAEHGIKLDQARDLIEKALKLEPKSAAYMDSLGWVLYKLNRPEEALAKIKTAIEWNDEPDATLLEHLGDVYAALKQSEKAREAYTKSLAIEPNEDIRKKVMNLTSNVGPDSVPKKP